jgi:hypothetical protein
LLILLPTDVCKEINAKTDDIFGEFESQIPIMRKRGLNLISKHEFTDHDDFGNFLASFFRDGEFAKDNNAANEEFLGDIASALGVDEKKITMAQNPEIKIDDPKIACVRGRLMKSSQNLKIVAKEWMELLHSRAPKSDSNQPPSKGGPMNPDFESAGPPQIDPNFNLAAPPPM